MMQNLYEAMYIVDPARSEQEVERLTERLKSEIVEKGGEVTDLHHLGKRRLAYPVQKKKDGFYFLMHFRFPPDRISELRAGYRLNDSILRFLILKKKEREPQFAGEKTDQNCEEAARMPPQRLHVGQDELKESEGLDAARPGKE